MFDKVNVSKKKQGNVGLTAAIFYYTTLGFTVSLPINDSQDYDLIVDKENILFKVQVKTSSYARTDNNYQVKLTNTGGTSGTVNSRVCDSSANILFVLTEDGRIYEIPEIVFKQFVSQITLGDKFKEYLVSSLDLK